MKEHVKNWSDKTYEVVVIDKSGLHGQTRYKLEGLSKGYFRNELLLVEWIDYLMLQKKNDILCFVNIHIIWTLVII